MSMYVRLKRQSTTVFMHVEPTDNFLTIKNKAGGILKMDPGQIGLFADEQKGKELVDLATIADQEIENDKVIYMVFRKGDGYEDVEVQDFESQAMAEEAA